MLVRFEASNFRSISDSIELSMVAVDVDREQARPAPNLGESLLTVAAIYGPNASGKSNVVAALSWVRDAVQTSLRLWDETIPTQPFAFGNGPTRTSQFTVETIVRGVRFEYMLEIDSERVHYEALFHYPEKKRRRVFERDGGELKLQRGLGRLSGTRELLTDRTLALSAARRFDEPLVSEFANDLVRIQTLGIGTTRQRPGYVVLGDPRRNPSRSTTRWFETAIDQPSLFPDPAPSELSTPNRLKALALLRLADLGIEDVQIDEETVSSLQSEETRTRRTLRLVHSAGEHSGALDFSAESEGTKAWFQLIGPVLEALSRGSISVFDELDASLHPTLSSELIKLFHSPTTNPLGAQIIFTSHDTSLLNHLNRDEIWLTEKRPDASTRLGALAEFAGERVRSSRNLENAYLHGRFGALPQLDEVGLLRALGLIG